MSTKIKFNYNVATKLIAYLPFDTSTTEDLCGNTWTAESDAATISTNDAISGKALTGGRITLTTPIMLGGQDFTVDFWFKASTNNWQSVLMWRDGESLYHGAGGLFGVEQTNDGKMNVYITAGEGTADWISSTNSMAHYAFVYQHSARTLKVYRNGILVVTKIGVTINRTAHTAQIGKPERPFAVDEFRVFDGVALWTQNFTPPTATNYAESGVGVTEEIPLMEGKPAGKRLAIYHNGKTYYAPLVAPDAKAASAFHLTYGGTAYALCTNPVNYLDLKYFAQYCTVYLPFDTSTTEDLCGNTWTAYGSPTIANGALKLDGNSSYLAMNGGITLGGQDFTIRGKFNMSSSAGSWPRILQIFNTANSNNDAIYIARDGTNSNLQVLVFQTNQTTAITLGRDYDFELNYSHDESTVRFFLDGVLKITLGKTVPRTTFANFYLGRSNWQANPYFTGSIDEFQIFDGVALHTENFTPPTDADYAALKVALDSGSKSKSSSKQSAVIEEPEEDIQGGVSTSTDLLKANLFSINGMSAYTDLLNESISSNSTINPAVAFAYSNAYALWGLSLPQL